MEKVFCIGITLCYVYILSVRADKPNIVLIIADDYGFNDIGYHGVDHMSAIKTPFLDSLAMAGVRLENYYVQPICTPSRSQLMSGRYQIHTGLQHGVIEPAQPNGLSLDNILMPEQLKHCGYDTHMIGKWHLGFFKEEYLPWKRGFDTYFGYLTAAEDYYTKLVCEVAGCGIDMDSEKGPTNETYGEYSAHLYTRKAKEVIDRHNKSKPMFLYIALQSVHAPLQVPEHYTAAYADIKDLNRRLYGGMVAAMDEAVKNITEHLEMAGLWNNTLLVFTTDNGGQTQAGGNNWPLRGRKSTLWEGGVRGVGFVHGKMLNVPNPNVKVNNELIHISDWYPTMLSAAQCSLVPGTQSLDGFDQWKTISTYASTPRTELLHNIDPKHKSSLNFTSKQQDRVRMGFDTTVRAGIRVGDWKLLTGDPGYDHWVVPPESQMNFIDNELHLKERFDADISANLIKLFNIKSDPYEKSEVSGKYPGIVDQLLTKLAKYNSTAVPVDYPASDFNASPNLHGGYWQPWRK